MYSTLVSVEALAEHLTAPDWIVFDCRHDLADVELGRQEYARAHIPGARFLHLDADLSGAKTGSNGRHPLPDPSAFCRRLASLGMSNDKQAVAYDASGGYYAARLWWMLRWVGHLRGAVLDGGWDAWVRAAKPVTDAPAAVGPGDFRAISSQGSTLQARDIEEAGDATQLRIVDARSPDRFRGENESLDPVGGHIPGALNRFFKHNLDADGRFKPAVTLEREFSELLGETPATKVIHQCGSGVTACHNLLAMEVAGMKGSKLYPGSWSEWCSDPRRAIAR